MQRCSAGPNGSNQLAVPRMQCLENSGPSSFRQDSIPVPKLFGGRWGPSAMCDPGFESASFANRQRCDRLGKL